MDRSRKARPEPGVRGEEPDHELRVAGHDDDESLAIDLHLPEERLDGFMPEVVASVICCEGVRLVDEEDAVERLVHERVRLDRGLTHVLRAEPGAIGFDQVALLQDAESGIHPPEQARDGGLARAGVADEYEVLRHVDNRETSLAACRLHTQEVDELPYLLLDRRQADQALE